MRFLILAALALFPLLGDAAEHLAGFGLKSCTAGTHGWYYTDDGTTIRAYGRSCLPGKCLSDLDLIGKARAILSAAEPASAANAALVGTPPDFDCNDPTVFAEQTPRGALCRERLQFVQAHFRDVGGMGFDDVQEPTCAPPVTYRVKVNGTATDRPASTLVGGVRFAITGFRAVVGQPCDVTKPTLASGTDLWAQYGPDYPSTPDGRPLVALCSKVVP